MKWYYYDLLPLDMFMVVVVVDRRSSLCGGHGVRRPDVQFSRQISLCLPPKLSLNSRTLGTIQHSRTESAVDT